MRPIDADELIEKAKYEAVGMAYPDKITFPSTVEWLVEKMPTITPERKRGRWVGIDDEPCEVYECDVCGAVYDTVGNTWDLPNYCPECGAYMGGGQNEAD